ncbi:hypothetical protein [[Kitasatospora] papulosa]|uniref:hypothetical protein n=1 Tax=[Kitasatospora] papulosa TaxID=1464011 RepID=UPI0036ABC9A3
MPVRALLVQPVKQFRRVCRGALACATVLASAIEAARGGALSQDDLVDLVAEVKAGKVEG